MGRATKAVEDLPSSHIDGRNSLWTHLRGYTRALSQLSIIKQTRTTPNEKAN
jgi:hypothetical protein